VINDAPDQNDYVDKLHLKFDVESIVRCAGICRTTVEHWFRYDCDGYSFLNHELWQGEETLNIIYYYTDRGKTYFPLKLQTTKNSQKTKRICKNCGKLNKNSIVKYEPLMVRLWE